MVLASILTVLFLWVIMRIDPRLDETSEGDVLLWYSPILKRRVRKYIKLY